MTCVPVIQSVTIMRLAVGYMLDKIKLLLLLITFPICMSGAVFDTVPDIHNLKEVVVTPQEIVQTQEKLIINVSTQVRKHSYDGYSMLSNLMLPGVNVDLLSSKISAYETNVLLSINGIKASTNEIKTLNPKDVIRIDYYTGFNPNFPTEQYVIDFIVKIRDYGGAVMLHANQSLNRPTGDNLADWRMFKKSSEFGVRVQGDYDHFASVRGRGTTYYEFINGNVDRRQEVNTCSNHINNLKGGLHFLNRFKRGIFKAALSFEKKYYCNLEEMLDEIEKLDNTTIETADIFSHKDRLLPSLLVSYDHKFINKSTISVSFNGDYAHTKSTRNYLSEQDVMSNTREDFYSFRPRARYTLPLSKKHTLFAEEDFMYRHSDIYYTENSDFSASELTNIWSNFAVGDIYRLNKKLSLFIVVRMHYEVTKNSVHDEYEFFFTPTARISWMLPKGNLIRGEFSISSSKPSLSMYSTDEKWIDPFSLRKGNPYLKSSNKFSTTLSFTSNHKWGMFQIMSRYNLTSDAVFLDIIRDDTRQMYVQTFDNGGNYEVLDIMPTIQLNIIPNKLRFRTSLEYLRVDTRTYKHLHSNCFFANVGLTYMNRGFRGQLNFSSPRSSIDQYGEEYYNPVSINLSAGYAINNWSINIFCKNPFMKTRQRISISLPGITSDNYNWRPRVFDNNLSIRISYRFNYGKRNHKYQDVEIESIENSAILEH